MSLLENIGTVLALLCGLLFVIFMNVQGHFVIKLNELLKTREPELYKKLILKEFLYGLFIPRPIRLIKYIWKKNDDDSEISQVRRKIRLSQTIGVCFLLAPLAVLFMYSLIFG